MVYAVGASATEMLTQWTQAHVMPPPVSVPVVCMILPVLTARDVGTSIMEVQQIGHVEVR